MTAPKLQLPESPNTVRVRMFDTTTNMVVGAEYFVEPILPGHEGFNLNTVGFLIENERLGKQIVYDLGCRKDFWNSPPALRDRMTKILMGLRVEKGAAEVLEEAGVDIGSTDSVIWSHAHWDHIGDITTFPLSAELVVGPGFTSAFLPAFPTNPTSRLDEASFQGRHLRELPIDPSFTIGDFPAWDFFGDGSFYLLHAPGHCIGHICGLARTTPNTFIFMGGDICHFPGYFRPSEAVPLPDPILASTCLDPYFPSPCPCSVFEAVHPAAAASDDTDTDKDQTRRPHRRYQRQPFYSVTQSPHSAYVDREQAVQDIRKMQAFDACPDVLICLAHDPTLLEVLPTLNQGAPGKSFLNDWKARGWKERCQWGFLNELPRVGERGREALVKGIWREGREVENLA